MDVQQERKFLTLRKYFKDANIIGAEINKNSLDICRNLKVDNKIKFINSNDKDIRRCGKYDLIFLHGSFAKNSRYYYTSRC